ncbi:ABC transporter substrate-binding protein [bacterium]|nr:ABC transporter substrate-binding protein [bacterium]
MRIHFVICCLLTALIAGCAAPAAPSPNVTTDATADTRTITHAMGETEIPAVPQRVVVLDTGETDNALALGANVVGAPVGDVLQYQEYLAGQLDGITDIGTISEPNLETIVQLEPDLILGSKQRYEAIYDELSAIAPTVFVESLRVPWQDNFRLHAEALGKTAEAEALLADYDARTEQVRQALGEDLPTISIIRFRPGQVRLYLKSSYIGYILQDVGLPRPPAQDQDLFSSDISLEQIADVDADYLFVTGYAQDDSDLATFLESELWTTLSAVQNERVVDVNDDTWVAGLGVQSANLVLNDLINIFRLNIDEAAAPGTDGLTAITCSDGERAITGNFGDICIPATPQRIIAMNEGVMANLLALGVTPIGVVDWANRDFTQYLGDTTQTIASVGTTDGPNYEAMLLLNPDLILAMPFDVDEETLPLLSQIAPVAVSPFSSVDWRGNILFTGEAAGKMAAAEALVSTSNARLEEFRTAYAAQAPANETIAIIRSRADTFNIYNKESFIAELSKEAGLRQPAAFDEIEAWNSMSMEAITLLTSDKLFVMVRNEREAGAFLDLAASPLWQTIPAVQQDEVHLVNWSVWVAGWNIVGANLVIDDLFFFMLGEESPTPNPVADLIIPDYGPLYDEERLGIEQ